MTDDITALRASGSGAASNNRLNTRVGELEQESTALKASVATTDSVLVQLRANKVVLSAPVDNMNNALRTSRTEVQLLNGKLTTFCDELTTAHVKDVRSANFVQFRS